MSEPVDKTAAGATRTFLGALAFIFLMLGIEGMVGAAGIPFGLGLFLALIGALCFFAAFFWETAKKRLASKPRQLLAALLKAGSLGSG